MNQQEDVPDIVCGQVAIHVSDNEAQMGARTATAVVDELKSRAAAGQQAVLWLMAAPSAFPFYGELIHRAQSDAALQSILRDTHFFQFDDYPIARTNPRYEATFRHLLETRLYRPLVDVCGPLNHLHPLELTGGSGDGDVQRRYRDELLALRREGAFILQIKGTGMDGHWGFHGAETPLDQEPGMIVVPMASQNIRQQMLDWPRLFPTPEKVPSHAVTFNVAMFMLADRIIDNTPQAGKEYAVLAAYGTEEVVPQIPSSALKRHHRAEVHLTAAAARALLEFRAGRRQDPAFSLSQDTLKRLAALWHDPEEPATGQRNREQMYAVLTRLGMIAPPNG
jgi:glucosamine-6-phosphate deaminase